jgi:hypothetical protein
MGESSSPVMAQQARPASWRSRRCAHAAIVIPARPVTRAPASHQGRAPAVVAAAAQQRQRDEARHGDGDLEEADRRTRGRHEHQGRERRIGEAEGGARGVQRPATNSLLAAPPVHPDVPQRPVRAGISVRGEQVGGQRQQAHRHRGDLHPAPIRWPPELAAGFRHLAKVSHSAPLPHPTVVHIGGHFPSPLVVRLQAHRAELLQQQPSRPSDADNPLELTVMAPLASDVAVYFWLRPRPRRSLVSSRWRARCTGRWCPGCVRCRRPRAGSVR